MLNWLVTLLLLLSPVLFYTSCSSEQALQEPLWDQKVQRQQVERFIVAHSRGNLEDAYLLVSLADQKVIERPLHDTNRIGRAKDLRPFDLLRVVLRVDPYDIRTMTFGKTFDQMPSPGQTTDVVVSRTNGPDLRFSLIWEEQQWRIQLGFATSLH